jgi:hypothetical protein
VDIPPVFDTTQPETAPAPLFVLRDVTTQSGFRPAERTATNTPSRGLSDDVIVKGIIVEQDAISLIALFREHYGRWVYFNPQSSTATLLEDVRKSPLLLCACCLIAVRHTTQPLASHLAPRLFKEARALLSAAMLSVPQPIEFFQASLVLSMWSTTIGQIPLTIDSWLLSGFALQHSLANSIFPFAVGPGQQSLEKKELDNCRLFSQCLLAWF